MRFALFREVPKRQRRKKQKLNSGAAIRKGSDQSGEEADDDEESDEEQGPVPPERMSTPARTSRAPTVQPMLQDPIWGDDSQDISMAVDDAPPVVAGPSTDGTMRPER
jgi:DNA replication licensing factor MCM3